MLEMSSTCLEDSMMWKDNLKEWILEERKVVSYKWLSKQLGVHVNTAKQMLFAFAEENGAEQKLDILYLLAGRLRSNPAYFGVCVVEKRSVGLKESDFESITSKHVYAVAVKPPNGIPLMTETTLINVDLMAKKASSSEGSSRYAAISNKKSVPRRPDIKNPEPKLHAAVVNTTEVATSSRNSCKMDFQSGAVMGMFKQKGDETRTYEKVNSESQKMPGKQLNGIAGMFAKASKNTKTKSQECTKEIVKRSPENCSIKANSDNSKSGEKRCIKSDQRKDRPTQKRRRIQVMSDSDGSSDGESDDVALMDSPPPAKATLIESDDEEMIPPTPEVRGKGLASGRHRVKKLVSKTYLDSDGFMVTKKEMGSCSESDEEADSIEQANSGGKVDAKCLEKKKSLPLKASTDLHQKQASIMNFFKKKSSV